MYHKNGSKILVESRWTLVRNAAGEPESIMAINTDITERKRLEQQFLRAQRLESIGTLAGGIAHDLNNVLSPIMLSIDLLRMTCGDDRAQDILSTIGTSARRGADMVKQILSFARGVDGERSMVSVAEIVKDMQNLVQDTFPKNIRFHADVEAATLQFLGDHTQVHQVLLNLCVNARDAMPAGGTLTVSARTAIIDANYASMSPDAKAGTYVAIKVEDTGTGIPPEVVDKIFDPFFTTKDMGKGTGLGLSTVLAIVKSHGGFLTVQSEPGRGTTFTACFPSVQSPCDMPTELQEEAMHPRGNDELVLIVDDEETVLTIARQTLEAYGYQVVTAADGAEAVAIYAQRHQEIDAVLVDMMMPVMDGPATIGASGLNMESACARAAGLGVEYFLAKPFTAQAVLTTLKQLLPATAAPPQKASATAAG